MSYRPHLVTVLLASAGVHAALAPEHLEETPVLGCLFVASVLVAAALAGVVVAAPTRRVQLVSAATLVLFALAYVLTRVSGLDALGIPHEEPDRLGIATVTLELLGAAFALSASRRARPAPLPAR